MPVSYSTDQLTQINAAKAKVTAAETVLKNAQDNVNNLYKSMSDKFSAGALSPNDCYSDKKSLPEQIAIGTMNKGNCKTTIWNPSSIYSCPNCPSAVEQFNAAFNSWKDSKALVAPAQAALTQAIKDRDDLIQSIANQNAHDPAIISANNQALAEIDAAAATERTKWIFFGLATVIIVGSAIYLGSKLLKRTSATS